MSNKQKLYEGKAKIVFSTSDHKQVIQYFKDDITAFNNKKHDIIPGKGIINNHISALLMNRLESMGVRTHFVKFLNIREQLVKKLDIIPLEVVVRNIAAGSFCKRFGLSEGEALPLPLVEFFYKNDALSDPLVSEEHIISFQWLLPWEIEEIKLLALRVNDFLRGTFYGVEINLIDFKLEFGKFFDETDNEDKILLADEISPDTCRLWDIKDGKKLDKDRYRLGLGEVLESYQEVAKRLGILPNVLGKAISNDQN